MRIKVNPFSFLLLLFFCFFSEKIPVLCLLLSAFIHETSHLCFFSFFGAKARTVEILPFGISASFDGVAALSYRQEVCCIAAGPSANLLLGLFLWLVSLCPSFRGAILGIDTMILCNLALGGVNLLPIYPLDGGRILFCFLKSRLSYPKAENCIRFVSYLFLLPLLFFGVWLAICAPYNFSVIFIFSYLAVYLIVNGIE